MHLILLFLSVSVHADMVFTHCEKWEKKPAEFKCSNGKTYLHGEAYCSTTDTRPNGKNSDRELSPIFCEVANGKSVDSCYYDSLPSTEACFGELKKQDDIIEFCDSETGNCETKDAPRIIPFCSAENNFCKGE